MDGEQLLARPTTFWGLSGHVGKVRLLNISLKHNRAYLDYKMAVNDSEVFQKMQPIGSYVNKH